MERSKNKLMGFLAMFMVAGCAESTAPVEEPVDPRDECVFCDEKADAFGISRESYLAYGILEVANTATFEELDDDVPLDVRAARGIVAERPFEFIEQVDTVSYVGRVAFGNLAEYAEANGFVPYCGDGARQPLLESCDDGNAADGDGCSALCEVEEGFAANPLAERSELIPGADIGIQIVDPNAFYLRQRQWKNRPVDGEVAAIFDRADGIKASVQPDDVVTFDELAILSKSPFYESLFADEKAALAEAWELFEVNSAPPVVLSHATDIEKAVEFTPVIERPGPLAVQSTRQISDLDDTELREVCRRLQQMPGANADGDVATVDFADVEKGLLDYDQVFTPDEYELLFGLHNQYINEAEPSTGGDFVVEFDTIPNQGPETSVVASFDDYEFQMTIRREIYWNAYDPLTNDPKPALDANVYSAFWLDTALLHNGVEDAAPCGYWDFCAPFRHDGVHFMTLDGEDARADEETGLLLMEHWENGQRIYNRVIDVETEFEEYEEYFTLHSDYAAARPALADGTPLSLRRSNFSMWLWEDYQHYDFEVSGTATNRTPETILPYSYEVLEERLQPGRYEEFHGIVLDIHESRAAVVYDGSCVQPLAIEFDSMWSALCIGTGRSARIKFDGGDARLVIYESGDVYDSILLYSADGTEETLDLDRSYYEVQ